MSGALAENSVWERLRALLSGEGGLMASLVDGPVASEDVARSFISSPAQIALEGPRVEAAREDYELILETIYEGYLLHYRAPRVMRAPEADLGLLAGDRLYALGLARLVAQGDVPAVAELADVITLSALAHAAGDGELADAVWAAGARAVGWGTSSDHEYAKALVRGGSPDAPAAMRSVCPS